MQYKNCQDYLSELNMFIIDHIRERTYNTLVTTSVNGGIWSNIYIQSTTLQDCSCYFINTAFWNSYIVPIESSINSYKL